MINYRLENMLSILVRQPTNLTVKISDYTLGIDMGVASIGWAVVSTKDRFIDCGVRIFPSGVDNFNSAKEKHPNIDRRTARGMRRRIRRKAERKKLIRGILQDLGWMPTDENQLEDWLNLNVYELRSRAIREEITLEELGRIILHINQRRGFLSLRKSEEANADKEAKGMLGEISALQKAIDSTGAKTLGNYLHQIYDKEGITVRIRSRHIRRSMLHDEFSLIWETQAKYHDDLTETLRYGSTGKLEHPTKVVTPIPREKGKSLLEQFGLENITFFQRRVYWPASSIGNCELEHSAKRAPIADRRFQEFRMLQEINNLRLLDNSDPDLPQERELTEQERDVIIAYITGKKEVKFDALKKHLCKHKSLKGTLPEAHTQISFNLEAGGRSKISATSTDALLSGKNGYGKEWVDLTEATKNQVIEALTSPAAIDEEICDSLDTISELDKSKTNNLLKLSLPSGYCNLSIIALEKLLPPMREGKLYMAKDESDSAMHAAGYTRRDEKDHKTVNLLPVYSTLLDESSEYYDPQQTEINNPVVLRAITELRKVVNGLIKKHGTPSRIHLEMARDVKMSPKQRSEHQKQSRQFEKARNEAAEAIEKLGIVPNNDAINTYRLWMDQDKMCVYSGKTIGVTQLFGGEVDVDHIFPFSRSADNSFTNKVVCFAKENRDKGNKTPYEWLYANDHDKFEEILQRAKKLPGGKYKRFIAKEIPEGFVNRDLNDTSWMTKAAVQYLARLLPKKSHILGIKGRHTATLRSQWELHGLLREDDLNLKNRDDHRHHALDAIVIALSDQNRLQQITKKINYEMREKEAKEAGKRIYRLKATGDKLDLPWESFRLDVAESLNSIWVSHRASRKLTGALHKETNYGKTRDGLLVVRKAVQSLSKKEVEGIRDPMIKQVVKDHIADSGGDRVAALAAISEESPLIMPSGTPIRKVRTAIPYAHITLREGTEHETHVQSASTHHLAIFSLGDEKYHFEPVTLYEASRRKRNKEPIVQKVYDDMPPEAEFLFHLCSGDSMMATIDGQDQLFIFKTMATSTGQIWFASHMDAAQGNKNPDTGASLLRSCMPGSFENKFPDARKVCILPTGEVRSAQ